MNLKIYNEENVNNSTDDQLFVTLKEICFAEHKETHEKVNYISIDVVNKKGEEIDNGTIIILCPIAEIVVLIDNINDEIPLKTDLYGNPLTVKENEYKEFMFSTQSFKEDMEEKIGSIKDLTEKLISKINGDKNKIPSIDC